MNRNLSIAIIILALSCVSFRWPVDNGRLTATFGESRGDHFHDGIDMVSLSDHIYPVDRGKLVFAWNRALFPLENYWGGGNYKIIKHENGQFSLYMHLQDGENLKPEYDTKDIIGYMGNTGHSYGKHIHFSILDSVKRTSVNPYTGLPAYEDREAPKIMYFYVKIGERYVRINENSSIRLTNHYPLLVEIRDSVTGRENLGIYKLKAVFNGKEVLNTEFSSITYSEKGLTVQDKVFDDIFDEKGYYRIPGLTYSEGINSVTVTASDFNGNTAEKVFTVDVHLDMQPENR